MGHSVALERWKRREHLRLYRAYVQPFFSVCVEVDATAVWRLSKSGGGPPFFLSSLFLMLRAANATEAFRLRLRKRGVWLHDRVAVGPTVLKDDDTFAFARIESDDRLDRFIAHGESAIADAQTRKTLEAPGSGDDVIYQSSVPWLRFTSFTNAIRGGDSIPRVVFGKCSPSGRRFLMPVAVEVHHAVVDGSDVAAFLERFQTLLSEFEINGVRPSFYEKRKKRV